MNAERLLAHYERISDAPDAIARLRSFILNLAVRGKLVLQDPKDEPASELLKRIAKERARREKTRTLREQRSLPQISAEDIDFAICKGWQLVRLGDVIKLWNGFAFKSGDFQSEGVPVIRIGDLQGGVIELSNAVYVSNATAKTVGPEVWIPPDALLIAMSGATTGKTAFNRAGIPLLLNQRVGRIEVFSGNVDYIRCFFETIVNRNLSISFGTAIPNLSTVQINETVIALPPLAEQHRIVAKVDELMALCDRLEAARAEREATRDRLTAASLARLNTPDAATFQADASFALNTIPSLTTRPDQIKQLRQTILNLAVRGKLVPQNPEDGTGAEMIKSIRKARITWEAAGRIRKEKDSCAAVLDAEEYLELPTSWKWARLIELGQTQTGTSPSSTNPDLFGNFIPFIKPSDLDGNEINYGGPGLSEAGKGHSRLVSANSVMMVCIGATLGKVNTTTRPVCFNQQINSLTPFVAGMTDFIALALKASGFQALAWSKAGIGTLPIISKGKWEILPIPLPPLAEQYRIVAKVDALMKICDQLEVSLDHTATTRRRLLAALLAEALMSFKTQELEAAE